MRFNDLLAAGMAADGRGTLHGIVSLATGVLAVLTALAQWRSERRLRAVGARADGVVTRLVRDGVKAYPVFAFQTPDGRRFEVESRLGTSPPMFRAGAAVPVLYDPVRPEHARIDRAAFGVGTIALLAFVGAAFAVFGLVLLRYG